MYQAFMEAISIPAIPPAGALPTDQINIKPLFLLYIYTLMLELTIKNN